MRRVRVRLTLASAGLVALVFVAAGAFVYLRFESALLGTVNAGLRSRADALLSAPGGPSVSEAPPAGLLVEPDDAFAQILAPDGTVLASSSGLAGDALLPPRAAGAVRSPRFFEVSVATSEREVIPARVLAVPTGDGRVLLIGASLDDQHEALERLALLLAIGGPIALALVIVVIWLVVGLALRPVEAAIERERRFVDDASHELRTPLANLRAELDLALSRSRSREELEAAMRSASEETDRLARLADDLLVLARADRGLLRVRRERVAIADLVARSVDPFAARALELGVEIEQRVPDGDDVEVDEVRLRQALGNLLDNALRYTPAGGRITVEAARRGGVLRLEVRDTGEGFPPGSIPRVFDAFTRPDGSRSRSGGGAGLGLAIVRAVAEAHGGTVEASATPSGGAAVALTVPG